MCSSKENQVLLDETLTSLHQLEQRLGALISRRDTRKEIAEDYTDFNPGVKEVFRAKKRKVLYGICGVVAELINVPERFEVAIETALGNTIQNIIVKTETHAREAMTYLIDRQLDRATFLPMDIIHGVTLSKDERDSIGGIEGVIGIATDLISFNQTFQEIFFSLLGNVIIVQSLEDAYLIAAKVRYRYRVVTLEGEVVNLGGAISGGILNKKTMSILGQQRLIEELDQEIRTLEIQISGLKSMVSNLTCSSLNVLSAKKIQNE